MESGQGTQTCVKAAASRLKRPPNRTPNESSSPNDFGAALGPASAASGSGCRAAETFSMGFGVSGSSSCIPRPAAMQLVTSAAGAPLRASNPTVNGHRAA